jgi:hypothetical protein
LNLINYKYKFSIAITLLILVKSLKAGSYGDSYGAHPSANARGNAVNAIVSGSAAVFYNPAGLARLSDSDLALLDMEKPLERNNDEETMRPSRNVHELAIQYNYAMPRLTTSIPNPDRLEGENDNYVGLGLALDFGNFYNLDRKIKFGLNILAPASGNLLTINDQNPTVHRALQYGVQNERPTIMGGLGIEVWKDHLYLGVGFTALATGQGSILMKDVDISPDPTTPDQQAILELKPLVNPTFGAQFHWGDFDLGMCLIEGRRLLA